MVNVGTWMVSLAYAMGVRDMQELNLMCQAGMVHDIGKIFVPQEILNKPGKLSEADWQQLRSHPTLGVKHLKSCTGMPELVMRVTGEHHERLDGTGYPNGIKGDQMLFASRICAVVDSFDAMTALRPFKNRTESAKGALRILQSEATSKYDPEVVAKWTQLMEKAEKDGAVPATMQESQQDLGRRKHERFEIQCSARVHCVELNGAIWQENQVIQVTAHSLSNGGLGFLSRQKMEPSQYVRVHLLGQGTLADRKVEGQIVRCRPYADGQFEVGLAFTSLEDERQAAQKAGQLERA
jgi:hypothetical protein